jgi:hypothetical protein
MQQRIGLNYSIHLRRHRRLIRFDNQYLYHHLRQQELSIQLMTVLQPV